MTIAKFECIAGGASLSIDDYDKTFDFLKKDIAIEVIPQSVFVHSSFAPTEAKRLRIAFVYGPDKEYWFAKILIPFLREDERN